MKTVLWTQFANLVIAVGLLHYIIAARSETFHALSFFSGTFTMLAVVAGALAWFYPPRKEDR